MDGVRGWSGLAVPPFRFSGAVYGVLLNHRPALKALGDAVFQAPYTAPPVGPVLHVKPRNTHARPGDPVVVPDGEFELEIGASLAIVMGRAACNVRPEDALDCVAGYTVLNDVAIPHVSYYRPALRFRARDGFCPISPAVVPASAVADPDALGVRVFIDGVLAQDTDTRDRFRPVRTLIADISEFMVLHPGDVIALGPSAGQPKACAGQRVAIEIEGVGRLENPLVSARGTAAGREEAEA